MLNTKQRTTTLRTLWALSAALGGCAHTGAAQTPPTATTAAITPAAAYSEPMLARSEQPIQNKSYPLVLASSDGQQPTAASGKQPNIVVIWGDDIGQSNISAYTNGLMGYRTPNIDRIAHEGLLLTDYYGEQSCTAGRAAFITGQSVFRTGLSKVGLPGADLGMRKEDPTIAGLLKNDGYTTGQFGKNHLGDKDDMLPTNHGFDEFYGNLYHLILLIPNCSAVRRVERMRQFRKVTQAARATRQPAYKQLADQHDA
jgi:Sulfatase